MDRTERKAYELMRIKGNIITEAADTADDKDEFDIEV